MESSNNNMKRTISPGMPPLSPTSQRMEGQSSQNPNINPRKRKRTMASRQHDEIFHPEEIYQIMQLEQIVKSLEAAIGRDSMTMYYWQQQHYSFREENEELKRKLDFFSHQFKSKQGEYVELKKKRDEIMEVYVEQQQKYEELTKCNMANAQFMYMDQLGFSTYNFMKP